jgi:hypothetical protein
MGYRQFLPGEDWECPGDDIAAGAGGVGGAVYAGRDSATCGLGVKDGVGGEYERIGCDAGAGTGSGAE